MKNKLYVVNRNTTNFSQGDIVESFSYQLYKSKTRVTDHKVIGLWSCCGCPKRNIEDIPNQYLEYLGRI